MAYFICSAPDFSDMLVKANSEDAACQKYRETFLNPGKAVKCTADDPTPSFIRACQMLGTYLEAP